MKGSFKAIFAAVAFGALAASTAAALAISEKVKDSCRGDYHRFCSAYAVGSTELRNCMEGNRLSLSKVCVDALVDAGEVPHKYLAKGN